MAPMHSTHSPRFYFILGLANRFECCNDDHRNTLTGESKMTYTVATRPKGSSFQFVPVLGFILMTLKEAQDLAQEYRASGQDAVAFNTQVGV